MTDGLIDNAILRDISSRLSLLDCEDYSMYGSLSSFVFQVEYRRANGLDYSSLLDRFGATINRYSLTENESLANGYLSLGVVHRHFVRYGDLQDDAEFNGSIRQIGINQGYRYLATGNLDFLYGATGIVHYLLNEQSISDEAAKFVRAFISHLDTLRGPKINAFSAIAINRNQSSQDS